MIVCGKNMIANGRPAYDHRYLIILLFTTWFMHSLAAPIQRETRHLSATTIKSEFQKGIRGATFKVEQKVPERVNNEMSRVVKRSDNDDDTWEGNEYEDENWEEESVPGQFSDLYPVDSGSSVEGDKARTNDGIAPVNGPYMKMTADGSEPADEAEDIKFESEVGIPLKKMKYRNWDEYLQRQKSAIKETALLNEAKNLEGSVERSVIHPDDHFRFMDKLFKEKNDRVKAFHALVLFMKEQGKSFKIPQKPFRQKNRNE